MSTVYGKGGTASGSTLYGLGGTASGTTIYTTETAVDTAWTPVTFDGINDYLTSGSGLTGTADGKQMTIVARYAKATTATNELLLADGAASENNILMFRSEGTIQVSLKNPAGTEILKLVATDPANSNERFIFFSTDRAITATHLYIDGVSGSAPTTDTNDNIRISNPTNWAIDGQTDGGGPYNGDMIFFYMDDSYIDFSVSANRDKFLQENIGASGEGPTGSSPLIYITGNAGEWNDVGGINLGTAGAFYMTGAVTDA
jgi:hypothetical protein